MKTKLLLVILCFAGITSCKKDNDNLSKVSIVGSWHLFDVVYSLADHVPSNTIVLNFDASGNYNETTNDTATAKGFYSVNFEQVDSSNQTFINYTPDLHNAPAAQAFRYNDTLVLIPEVVSTDGYELKYKKQ